jgi:hypothetical protein
MHGLRGAFAVVGVIVFVALGAAIRASSQALNRLPPARAPCTVLSGEPCHPSFCDVFHRGPCFPQYGAPVGENLQLTIVTTDDEHPADRSAPGTGKSDAEKSDASKTGNDADQAGEEKPLDSIGEMFAALRACWVPPPKDEARQAWNTRCVLLSIATARSSRRRASPMRATMHRPTCAVSIATR